MPVMTHGLRIAASRAVPGGQCDRANLRHAMREQRVATDAVQHHGKQN